MKTLTELMEGTVVSSDYKLSKTGRKYKAHRRMIEGVNPYSVDVDEATDKVVKDKTGKVISWMHAGDWKKATKKDPAGKVTNLSDKARRKTASMTSEAKDPREYDYEGDMAKSQLRSIIANAKCAHDMLKDDTNMAEWVQSKITLAADYVSTVADYMQSEVKEEAGLDEAGPFSYGAKPPRKGSVAYNATMKSKEQEKGKQPVEPKDQMVGIAKVVKEDTELDEARGRPAGAATLAKRATAASKPKEDDDESEQYDKDSGVEADQHIHVQLKKAIDSTEKPFEISFRNNKKHKVSSIVAKDILTATEKLKPEHRKQVHDQIHQSYDNLMGVHKMIKSI